MNAVVDSCGMLRIPIAGMDIRGLLEVLLPALLRGQFAISDAGLDEDDEDGRFCLKKKSMDEGRDEGEQKGSLVSYIGANEKKLIIKLNG